MEDSHGAATHQRPLLISLGITAAYGIVEIIGGLLTGSLALLADAGHMATDAVSLGLALFAAWMGQRPATVRKTFGARRAEVLAALANGLILWAMVGVIAHAAWARFRHPPEVQAGGMLMVAVGGLVANVAGALVLRRAGLMNLNVRSAYLHVVMDLLGSVAAIVGAVVILTTGWRQADPLISIGICALVMRSSWVVVREALHILMEGTPARLDLDEISAALAGLDGVLGVHDLHVWTLSSGFESLTCHLAVRTAQGSPRVLEESKQMLRSRFGLDHVTIQIEEQKVDTAGIRT